MMKYIVRKLDLENSNNERLVYDYKYFLHEGNSASARIWLSNNLEDLFSDVDPLLIDFRPVGQKSWRDYLRRTDIPDEEYPVTIEEFEEKYPLTENTARYIMKAFILTVPEDGGVDGFEIYSYFSASSFDEAVEKAKRTNSIELRSNEGTLCSDTLKIKKVGRGEKWFRIDQRI